MKLVFLFVGSGSEWQAQAVAEYSKKISAFVKSEIKILKPTRLARADSQQKRSTECDALLKEILPGDAVIVCDEAGDLVDTQGGVKKLTRLLECGKQRLVIVVGGAFGIDDRLRQRAQWVWSFSRQTMNHHIAQVVLLEQIYRFLTIRKGIPYHNE